MKKNYFMLAATTMMLAACAQTDVVNEIAVEETPQAIGFETFANKQTRAENSDKEYSGFLENHHESFKVWASKKVAENATESTSDYKYVEVYPNNNPGIVTYANSEWTASPLKYWDKTAKNYYFYAAAPSSMDWHYANSEANNGSTGYLTLGNFTLKGTANDNLASVASTNDSWKDLIKKNANGTVTQQPNDIDLMIADWINAYLPQSYYTGNNPTYTVHFNFYHILSRLNINVKAGANSPTIILKGLDVCGLNNKGSFTEMKITTTTDQTTQNPTTTIEEFENLSSGTHLRWQNTTVGSESPSSDGNSYTLSAYLGTSPNGLQLTSTAQATHKYLIIPQLVSNIDAYANKGTAPTTDAYIKINYTVDGEAFEAYYSLAQAFGIAKNGTLAFNEGWQNTLTITISPNAIQFTGAVAEWADKDNNTSDNNNKGDNAAID